MTASQIFDVANWVLLVSLISGVVATYAIVASTKIKEREAEAQVARLGNEAAQANARAAILEKETAIAQLETQRLKQLMAWRRLSVEQASRIAETLRGKISLRVRVSTLISDPEANQFHSDILSAFQMAGVDAHLYTGLERATGLWITNGATPDGELIKSAFAAAGFPLADRSDGAFGQAKSDLVEVIIGSKPPEFFTSERGPAKVDWHNEAIRSGQR